MRPISADKAVAAMVFGLLVAASLFAAAPVAATQPGAAANAAPLRANTSPHADQARITSPGQPVVAIGDIHGAYDSLVAILRETGIIDEDLRWSGGDTIFVQTGDIVDRGPDVRRCLDLLMHLQEEARAAGGELIVLLGNHEIMNLVTVFRDVAPEAFAQFAGDDAKRRRDAAWEAWRKVGSERAKVFGNPEPTEQDREGWYAAHPLGFAERIEAFGPDGRYGKWLRGLPIVARVDDTLFMHAGISPELAGSPVVEINERIRDEIERYDDIRREMVQHELITPEATLQEMVTAANDELARMIAAYGPDTGRYASNRELALAEKLESILTILDWQLLTREGFLWFRGFAEWSDEEGAPLVAETLEKQEVAHIVVAHTPQTDDNIAVRFGGGIFLIDTGMLTERYGGRPSALEIVDGTFTAVYVGERVRLLPPPPP